MKLSTMLVVENRTAIRVFAARDAAYLDYEGLGRLADEAYRHDYEGVARVVFDADYFEWLLEPGKRDWLAVIAVNASDEPVGCIVSLLRTLSYAGRDFPALYSTAWTVAPEYRNRNVAIRLARAHTAAFTDADNRQVGISMFHAGHSGMRAQGVFGGTNPATGSSGMRSFHRGALWSRRLLGIDAPATNPVLPCRMSHLSLGDGRLVAVGDVRRRPLKPIDCCSSVCHSPLRRPRASPVCTCVAEASAPALCCSASKVRASASPAIPCMTWRSTTSISARSDRCNTCCHRAARSRNWLPPCWNCARSSAARAACQPASTIRAASRRCLLERYGFSRSTDELISNLWATPLAVEQGFPGFQHLEPPGLVVQERHGDMGLAAAHVAINGPSPAWWTMAPTRGKIAA